MKTNWPIAQLVRPLAQDYQALALTCLDNNPKWAVHNKPSSKIICSLRLQHRKDPTPRVAGVECNNLELVPNSISLPLVMAVQEASAQEVSVAMLEVHHLEPHKANSSSSSHNSRLSHRHHSNSLHHKADYLAPQSKGMLPGPDSLVKPKSHPIQLL